MPVASKGNAAPNVKFPSRQSPERGLATASGLSRGVCGRIASGRLNFYQRNNIGTGLIACVKSREAICTPIAEGRGSIKMTTILIIVLLVILIGVAAFTEEAVGSKLEIGQREAPRRSRNG